MQGDSLAGSLRLRTALAQFYATQVPLATPVDPSQLVTSSGLSGFLDRVACALCDPGEAILIPRPYYNAFVEDFGARSEVAVVGAGHEGVTGTLAEVAAVEAELVRRERTGEAKVRAVLLTNPHNPLGLCYPREVLVAYARLVERHGLYLLVDEIYLAGIFNPLPSAPFTSILSIDSQAEAGCDPSRIVHLYAMSKDFGCNGFRVGVAVVRDAELYQGVMNGAFAAKIGSPSVSPSRDLIRVLPQTLNSLSIFAGRALVRPAQLSPARHLPRPQSAAAPRGPHPCRRLPRLARDPLLPSLRRTLPHDRPLPLPDLARECLRR